MKQTILFIIIFTITAFYSNAQILTPVSWEYSYEKISGDIYELKAIANIQKPWHLYGQYFEDGGPVKLVFLYEKNGDFDLIGRTEESPKPKVVKDDIFDIEIQYFSGKAVFTQKVRIHKSTEIKLNIEGQVCNDDTGMCVMVNGDHIFNLRK